MLTDLHSSNYHEAIALLTKGMRRQSPEFWQNVFHSIRAFGANDEMGLPYGQLLVVKDQVVGVMLTLANKRLGADGKRQRIINLSSWYIEPEHRWRGPLMMRSVLKMQADLVTDLTPTKSVQKTLKALGFRQINNGETIVALPFAAMAGRSRALVVDFSEVDTRAVSLETRRTFDAHKVFDCFALAMKFDGEWFPLLFKRCSVRKIPAVQLVYCERNSVILENLAALARFLMRRGFSLLIFDIPPNGRAPGINRLKRGRKFVKGEWLDDSTDYTGSELCLFDR